MAEQCFPKGQGKDGWTPNKRYFVAKRSIVAIYAPFWKAFVDLSTKVSLLSERFLRVCFRRPCFQIVCFSRVCFQRACFWKAYRESAFGELSTKVSLISYNIFWQLSIWSIWCSYKFAIMPSLKGLRVSVLLSENHPTPATLVCPQVSSADKPFDDWF